MKKIITALLGVVMLVLGTMLAVPALATGGGGYTGEEKPCTYPTITVVDYVEPAVPEVWANFSPNDHKGTFVGPAIWPIDERGTWHIHDKIPGGHEGPDGVYAKGNPAKGGNWFYRSAGKDEVTHYKQVPNPDYPCPPPTTRPTPTPTVPPVTETPVTQTPTPTVPPVTETPTPTVPPVTETPTVPPVTETPTVPPVTETPTPEQPTPTVPPEQPEPPSIGEPLPPQMIQCVDGVWVITVGDEVISESGTCGTDDEAPPTTFVETGY